VRLIPRIKGWAAANYPGTQTAITEYNWGAEGHINGATTQADILGIFGREGLDLAARWTTPATGTPTYKAIKMYRNYDGNKSAFGDTSVAATVPNPDNLSAFASTRSSDGALTVMVINKYLTGTTPTTINIPNFAAAGVAQLWQLTSTNSITRLTDISFSGNSLAVSLPPQSITLFVIPVSAPGVDLERPDSLTATVVGRSTVTLNWIDTSTGEEGFYIERTPKSLGEWERVGQVGPNATTYSEIIRRGAYSYRVQAFNATVGALSPYSNKVTIRTR
jgi:hypothetical protein